MTMKKKIIIIIKKNRKIVKRKHEIKPIKLNYHHSEKKTTYIHLLGLYQGIHL